MTTDPPYLPTALQVLLVLTPDWNSVQGVLYRYERPSLQSNWQLAAGSPVPINVGQGGMAWGNGSQEQPQKIEGDKKAPAGIFSLGPVFGDRDHRAQAQNMPFLLIDKDLECVDDPSSIHYNQFVDANTVIRDWKSSEKMQEIGFLYALGIVVGHNTSRVIGRGSCIFMHIWRDKEKGSHGCTVMEEKHLSEIVSWLNMKKNPCLVQLPLAEYASKKKEWQLPEITPYR